jgi:hypothetical protein
MLILRKIGTSLPKEVFTKVKLTDCIVFIYLEKKTTSSLLKKARASILS